MEQLDLVFSTESFLSTIALEVLSGLSVTNPITQKLPCPNMKVLRLQFDDLMDPNREQQVLQSCMWMMNNRRLAGHSLDKCYLWWLRGRWERDPSLAFVTENDTVRIEE